MLTTDELNSLRKLAPRSRSNGFLCEEHTDEFKTYGSTLSLRLDHKLLDEEIEFPDCASWRIATFNIETSDYCHHGFAGTFSDLLRKTAEDLQRVAGSYGPKARAQIMKSVVQMENFICGRPHTTTEEDAIDGNKNDKSSASPPSSSPPLRPVIFRIRDPSNLTRTSILQRRCMNILHEIRMKDVEFLAASPSATNASNNKPSFSDDDDHNKIIPHLDKLLPIYDRTLYQRTWEEERDLGLIEYRASSSFEKTTSLNSNHANTSLDGENHNNNNNNQARDIANLIQKSNRIVLLSGAGISVESGIKPFRTSTEEGKAIWKDFDASKMTAENFNTNDKICETWWKMKTNLYREIHQAEPNDAHKFFAMLHRENKLRGVITQNIDSLHKIAGIPDDKLVELHGHMRTLQCSDRPSEHNSQPIKGGSCDFIIEDPFKKKKELIDDVGKLNQVLERHCSHSSIIEGDNKMTSNKKRTGNNNDSDDNEDLSDIIVPLYSAAEQSSSSAADDSGYHFSSSSKNNNNKNNEDSETESRSWIHLKDNVPLCAKCGSPLRTPTIMFGQGLPPSEWNRARRMIGSKKTKKIINKNNTNNDNDDNDDFCDLLLVVGTTLIVAPANDLPGQCLKNDVPVVIVNLHDKSMYDEFATSVVREPAAKFFGEVAKEMGVELL